MKTLKEIKDEYAYSFWGCIDWDDAINYEGYTIDSDDLDRISNMWAIEVAKEALNIAHKKVVKVENMPEVLGGTDIKTINVDIILSETNIPKL